MKKIHLSNDRVGGTLALTFFVFVFVLSHFTFSTSLLMRQVTHTHFHKEHFSVFLPLLFEPLLTNTILFLLLFFFIPLPQSIFWCYFCKHISLAAKNNSSTSPTQPDPTKFPTPSQTSSFVLKFVMCSKIFSRDFYPQKCWERIIVHICWQYNATFKHRNFRYLWEILS